VTFGTYLGGVLGLVAVTVPMALAAVRLRQRLLPGWTGAPARLAEAVLGVSAFTVVLQVLGVFGILEPAILIGASIAVGVGIHQAPWLRPETEVAEAGPPPSPPVPSLQMLIALGAAAFVAAHWATGLQDVWARGMLTFDTLWYHGPFAARIAEAGTVWPLHFTDPLYLNWFYPQNSELLHGAGIALFERDIFSPLVNFGWLGLAFLAAWCIGRPYGVAPLSLVGAAIVMDTGPLVPREAGTPANDMAAVALLLAAAALLINAWAMGSRRGTVTPPHLTGVLLTAGLAIGVALGTKLTIAGATLALAIGLPLIVPPGARRKALLLFLGGVTATAGIWFIRNLIHSGNPLPWIQDIGPIDLPGPGRGLEGRDDYTVGHYIFVNPDTDVWSDFYKSITNLFGPVWFLILGGAALGAVLAVWRPRSRAVRLCGAVTIAAAIAYVFTPLTAAGPEGDPMAFGINLRYLAPGFALGLALLPLEPKLAPERWRLPLLIGGVLALVLVTTSSDSAYIWTESFSSIPFAALIGIVLVGAPVGIALLAGRSRALAAGAGVLLALAIAAVGWERQDDYFDHRYDRTEDFRFQLDDAVRWAKGTTELRIAVAGTSGAYNQYGLYGDELTNYVQYVGDEGTNGDFRRIEKCEDFRTAVNDGDYDYLVTTPDLDLNDPATARTSPERGWVDGDPSVEREILSGRTAVFRLDGELDPAGCGKKPK
jgi:hypothetical protein